MKSEWKIRTVGELTSYISKGIPPKYTDKKTNSTIVVLNQKCNRDYKISYEQSRLHDTTKKAVPTDKMLQYGDVLINSTGTGTAGRIAQFFNNDISTTVDGHMIIMRASKEIDYLYYGYALKSYQKKIESFAEGSTGQTEINKQRLQEELLIKYPQNIDLQRSIALILKNIDDKIELNNKINENLLQQAVAIFDNAIEQSEHISHAELGSLADVKGGKRLPKGVNLITTPNLHPYIRVRDLNDVVFASLSANYEYVDDETQKTISRYITSTGDVLISIVGTIGLTAIVDKSLDKANLTENCVKITNLRGVSPEYLILFLRSQNGVKEIQKGTVGAVQAKLPIKNIQSINIPLLPQSEMQSLSDTLTTLFSQISMNTAESKCLAGIRDSLLPRLMNGEIDVSEVKI